MRILVLKCQQWLRFDWKNNEIKTNIVSVRVGRASLLNELSKVSVWWSRSESRSSEAGSPASRKPHKLKLDNNTTQSWLLIDSADVNLPERDGASIGGFDQQYDGDIDGFCQTFSVPQKLSPSLIGCAKLKKNRLYLVRQKSLKIYCKGSSFNDKSAASTLGSLHGDFEKHSLYLRAPVIVKCTLLSKNRCARVSKGTLYKGRSLELSYFVWKELKRVLGKFFTAPYKSP